MNEQKQARQYDYELVVTDDGSPSVRMGSPTQIPEVMHHSGGALTESLYIYLSAVQRTIELSLPPHILSVGLGIGYNEAITAAHLLQLNRADEMRIASFEIDPVLRSHYLQWLLCDQQDLRLQRPLGDHQDIHLQCHLGDQKDLPPVTIDLSAIFSDVLGRVSTHFGLRATDVHSALTKSYHEGRFKIYEALEQRPPLANEYTCILFDAFSKKSTPDLWHEPFLTQFIADACAPGCVLATYAATGNLNRALRNSGFTLLRRSGFQGKRESTWAERPCR